MASYSWKHVLEGAVAPGRCGGTRPPQRPGAAAKKRRSFALCQNEPRSGLTLHQSSHPCSRTVPSRHYLGPSHLPAPKERRRSKVRPPRISCPDGPGPAEARLSSRGEPRSRPHLPSPATTPASRGPGNTLSPRHAQGSLRPGQGPGNPYLLLGGFPQSPGSRGAAARAAPPSGASPPPAACEPGCPRDGEVAPGQGRAARVPPRPPAPRLK